MNHFSHTDWWWNVWNCQVHPKLHQSLQQIVAQRVQLPSKKDELLGNFKLSVRGSIRKAPNVVPAPQLCQNGSWSLTLPTHVCPCAPAAPSQPHPAHVQDMDQQHHATPELGFFLGRSPVCVKPSLLPSTMSAVWFAVCKHPVSGLQLTMNKSHRIGSCNLK